MARVSKRNTSKRRPKSVKRSGKLRSQRKSLTRRSRPRRVEGGSGAKSFNQSVDEVIAQLEGIVQQVEQLRIEDQEVVTGSTNVEAQESASVSLTGNSSAPFESEVDLFITRIAAIHVQMVANSQYTETFNSDDQRMIQSLLIRYDDNLAKLATRCKLADRKGFQIETYARDNDLKYRTLLENGVSEVEHTRKMLNTGVNMMKGVSNVEKSTILIEGLDYCIKNKWTQKERCLLPTEGNADSWTIDMLTLVKKLVYNYVLTEAVLKKTDLCANE